MAETTKDTWNPEQYKKFQEERVRPFWDLTQKVSYEKVFRALDLGCGTGELTAALQATKKIAVMLGVDGSPKMLEQCCTHQAVGLSFLLSKIEHYAPQEAYDLIISNAALQWVGGHTQLIPRIVGWLNPGGKLAIQMPVNFDHPSHLLADQVAAEMGLKLRQSPVLAPEDYAQLLWENGIRKMDISMQLYLHPMNSGQDVIEWTRGTLLNHYENQLTPEKFKEFLSKYSSELLKQIGTDRYLYTFKRLFVVAQRN